MHTQLQSATVAQWTQSHLTPKANLVLLTAGMSLMWSLETQRLSITSLLSVESSVYPFS